MTATAWTIAILFLLIGAAAAAGVTWVLMRRHYGDRESAAKLRSELEAYREEVREHYVETARRVDRLTHAYKDVYDHLEHGAYRLVGEAELRERLDDGRSEPVTLEGIGQRRLTDGSAPDEEHREPRPHEARASDEALGYTGAAGTRAPSRQGSPHPDTPPAGADEERAASGTQPGRAANGAEPEREPSEPEEDRHDEAGPAADEGPRRNRDETGSTG